MRRSKGIPLLSVSKDDRFRQLMFFKSLAVNQQDIPLPDRQPALPLTDFLELSLNVVNLVFTYALQLSLTGNPTATFHLLRRETEKYKSPYLQAMVDSHIDHMTQVTTTTIPSLVYLAHVDHVLSMETAAARKRGFRHQSIRLPGSDKCQLLLTLINTMKNLMVPTQRMVINPSLEGGYSKVVLSGTVDAMTDDTLWLIQPQTCHQRIQDHYPLLAAWLMLQRSHEHRDKTIRYLSIVSPWQGKRTQIDVNDLTPNMIDELSEVVYPNRQQYELDLP